MTTSLLTLLDSEFGRFAMRRVGGDEAPLGHSVCAMSSNAATSGPATRLRWQCLTGAQPALDTTFAGLLKQLRVRAGMSQQQLAVRLGTTQSAIARLESGTAEPRLATLERLAEAFGEDLLVLVSCKDAQ